MARRIDVRGGILYRLVPGNLVTVQTWIALASAVIAVGSLGVAWLAVRRAREGNRIAERANEIAEAANEIAVKNQLVVEEAQRVAVDANEISEDANSIAQRALEASLDTTRNTWTVEHDGQGRPIGVRNDCAQRARDVRVVVDSEGHVVVDEVRKDELDPFDRILLGTEHLLDGKSTYRIGSDVHSDGLELRFSIRFRTERGHESHCAISNRYVEAYDGTVVII